MLFIFEASCQNNANDSHSNYNSDIENSTVYEYETETMTNSETELFDSTTDLLTIDPFIKADCETNEKEPKKCEYEWCKKRSTFLKEQSQCQESINITCIRYLECYMGLFSCLEDCCPFGTMVPEDAAKDSLHLCDNNFTDCTMYL